MRASIQYPTTQYQSGEIDALEMSVAGHVANHSLMQWAYVSVRTLGENSHGRSITMSMTPEEALLLGRKLIAEATSASMKLRRVKAANPKKKVTA